MCLKIIIFLFLARFDCQYCSSSRLLAGKSVAFCIAWPLAAATRLLQATGGKVLIDKPGTRVNLLTGS